MKKYICINYGECDNADAKPPIVFNIQEGEEPTCPECNKHKVRPDVPTRQPLPKWMKIVAAIVVLGGLSTLAYYYLGGSPEEPKREDKVDKPTPPKDTVAVAPPPVVKPTPPKEEPKITDEKAKKTEKKVVERSKKKTLPQGKKIAGSDRCDICTHYYYVNDGNGGKKLITEEDSNYCCKCGETNYDAKGHEYRVDCEPDGTKKIKLIR